MLSISDELKMIQQSVTEEERRRRTQQLQQRLHEDALQRKLRNVRLISSVERLAERAASLRQLTDRLRLIKRQYEVLATHLPDDEPDDQSQHVEPVASLHRSQSAVLGLGAGGGDVAAGASPLVEGYYDPRLAARGWQGAADPWGPASRRLGRDELGRSTESRAALLRTRIATTLTVRPTEPPPPPSGGQSGNFYQPGRAAGAERWERERGPDYRDQPAVVHGRPEREHSGPRDHPEYRDRSDRDLSRTDDRSGWDRSGDHSPRQDRSGAVDRSWAPQRDRSVSEYSVSAPGRRRAAPPAWDGTLDGVASRWGTLDRPGEDLDRLDSALDRQRRLLTAAEAAGSGATAPEQRESSQDSRFREDGAQLRGRGPLAGYQDSYLKGQNTQFREQDPHVRSAEFRDQTPHMRDQGPNVRFQDSYDDYAYYQGNRNGTLQPLYYQGGDAATSNRGPSEEHPPGHSAHGPDSGRQDSEPRCPQHQALHDAEQLRRQREEEAERLKRDREEEAERLRRDREEESDRLWRERERSDRDGSDRRAADEGAVREPVAATRAREVEQSEGWSGGEASAGREESRRGSSSGQVAGVRDGQEPDRRRQQEREQELRRQQERGRQALQRKTSVVSHASSDGSRRSGSAAADVSASVEQKTAAAGREAGSGRQTAKKKRNMDWLLEDSHSSDSDRPGGSTDKPTGGSTDIPAGGSTDKPAGGVIEGGPRSKPRPTTASSRQISQGSTTPTPAAVPVARRAADTSSSDEAAPAPAKAPAAPAKLPAAPAKLPEPALKLRLDSGSDSYHLSADLGGDDTDDDFWN